MPRPRFSKRAGDSLEAHREADLDLIATIRSAITDRQICEQELDDITGAIARVQATARPLSCYMVIQDQAFRIIQLVANTGGMTEWVDEQLRGMAIDRELVLAPVVINDEGPAATEPSTVHDLTIAFS